MNSNQILIITIIILIISGISTFINYTHHFSGNVIYDNVTFWQLVITDINHEEGVYRGWPGEIVGARISPARMCYDDEGSPQEMYIYYYGGEYPYESDSNKDYDNPENNKNIHFGTTRVTGDQPPLQVYFDKFGTYNIKGWPVWVTFSCGQANFNIKQGDALIIRYNNNQETYVKLPEINGTGDKTIFLSWPGEAYDNPQLTGEPLAPKICSSTGLDFLQKGNCTDDFGTKVDVCESDTIVQDWFCEHNVCIQGERDCQNRYGTNCVDGACGIKTKVCTIGEKKCEYYSYGPTGWNSRVKICVLDPPDGSHWVVDKICDYGCEDGTCIGGESEPPEKSEPSSREKPSDIIPSVEQSPKIIKRTEKLLEIPKTTITKKIVSCEFVWPQKIIINGITQQCNIQRPYCNNNMAQKGIAQCCKYDNVNYYDCQTIG